MVTGPVELGQAAELTLEVANPFFQLDDLDFAGLVELEGIGNLSHGLFRQGREDQLLQLPFGSPVLEVDVIEAY